MKFNQISYFLRSCDTLNFTHAAQLCHVSQPALSASIHALETDLGGALFIRHTRSVSLTPLGESMRMHLGRIEHARNAAAHAAANFNKIDSSTINLGLMCTLSPHALLSAIHSFNQDSSNVELLVHDVWESKSLELLLSGSLDCLIMAHTSSLSDQFEQQHLTDEAMVVAMHSAHPLAKLNSVRFENLSQVNYVDRLRCEFRSKFFEELKNRGIDIQIVLRSEREDLISESVANAIGIATMPQFAAEHAGLEVRPIEGMSISRSLSIVTAKDRELHADVNQFIQHIISAYKAR